MCDPIAHRERISDNSESESPVYELSRELFRSIRPGLVPDRRDPARPARTLLGLCEDAVQRIAQTPAARRRHAMRLFTQVRSLFPPSEQLQLATRIEVAVADVHDRLVEHTAGRSGGLLRCAATTRRHTPCMREPVPGIRYCPSHRHLDATEAGQGLHVHRV